MLSLLSVLSLRFRLKHETGLGFSLRLETPAWWWLRAWWLIGGLGLPISAWWWLGLTDLADLGLGLPQRRDPPRWPRREARTTIAIVKPAAKPCRADPNGLEVVEPCRSRPGGVGLGLEVVEPCRLVAEKLI